MKHQNKFSLSRFINSFKLDSVILNNILKQNNIESFDDLHLNIESFVRPEKFQLDIDFIHRNDVVEATDGLLFEWAIIESKFGDLFVVISEDRIFYLGFFNDQNEKTSKDKHFNFLKNIFNTESLNLHSISENSLTTLKSYIKLMEGEDSTDTNNKIKITLIASDFQKKVWQALVNVQKGQLSSYLNIASACQSPKASRAVGTAIGQNPICILVPCHRIITSDGRAGGYSNGLKNKLMLLCSELTPKLDV